MPVAEWLLAEKGSYFVVSQTISHLKITQRKYQTVESLPEFTAAEREILRVKLRTPLSENEGVKVKQL